MLYWEEVMLRTLCFDLIVAHPNWVMIKAVDKTWGRRGRKGVEQGELIKRAAWNFLGDA